jgi:hypothetical protein
MLTPESDESRDAHQQVYGDGGYDNQAKFSHEIVAGGAAFEGMKLFEDHQRKEGKLPFPSKPTFSRLTSYQEKLSPTALPKNSWLDSSAVKSTSWLRPKE